MFCRKCGKELSDDALFCSNCGTKVLNAAEGQPAQNVNQDKIDDLFGMNGANSSQNTPPPPQTVYVVADTKKINGLGIAGFVLSIVSLWLGILLCIAPITALVLSIVAFKNKSKYTSCNALALAGLIIASVTTFLWVTHFLLQLVALGVSCVIAPPVYY